MAGMVKLGLERYWLWCAVSLQERTVRRGTDATDFLQLVLFSGFGKLTRPVVFLYVCLVKLLLSCEAVSRMFAELFKRSSLELFLTEQNVGITSAKIGGTLLFEIASALIGPC